MSELSKGHTYNPGDIVDAADLNSLVDAATAIKGIIMDQPSATPIPADDSLLFHDLSADNLARCKISAISPGTVTSTSAVLDSGSSVLNFTVASPTTTPAFHLGLDPQVGNKVLASPLDGSSGVPGFRVLATADMVINVQPIAVLDIDLTLGNVFSKTLTATPSTLRLLNGANGQVFKVWVQQKSGGGAVLHWNAVGTGGNIRWPGGVEPVLTTLSSHIDIFEFLCMGSNSYYGIRWGADML